MQIIRVYTIKKKLKATGVEKMGTITHKAGRVAVGKAADVVIKNLDKDREKEILKLVDFMENIWMVRSLMLILTA